jgi:crotonobetainyl-CoA:carnitine CoA-transferase CaiB-like acyl-CoA transferase
MAQAATGLLLTGTAVLDFSANDRESRPTGNRSPYMPAAPHGAYPCAGVDRWIAIAVTEEAEWQGLVAAMGHPSWAIAQEFSTLAGRIGAHDQLDSKLGEWTKGWDTHTLMSELQAHGVPAGVCQTSQDKVEVDPQLRSRGFLVKLSHSEMGETFVQNVPFKFSATPATVGQPTDRASPCYGEDNFDVYVGLLGMTHQELADLQAKGVI